MYIETYTIYGTRSKKLYSITSKVIQYYKKIENCIEEVEIYFPGFQAFIDSTEQEIQRPKNKKRKKEYYSGKKKKTYCIKIQYMVNKKKEQYCINQINTQERTKA